MKLLFVVIFLASCGDQGECSKITELFRKAKYQELYIEAAPRGKQLIPCLINEIDLDEKGFVGFLDPNSSNIPPYHTNNYKGIQAAYLIESILCSNDSIAVLESEDLFMKTAGLKKGIIVKVDNNEASLKPLEYDDMKILKSIYKDWFHKVENLTITEIKKKIKSGEMILEGSQYKWI